MRLGVIGGVSLLALCGASSAIAASVEVVQGQVSLNRGSGYVRIASAAQANAGDMVMASANGRARVAFGNGCVLEVEPGMVVTVPADQACHPGVDHSHKFIIGGLAIAGGIAAIILLKDDDKPASP